MKNMKIKLTFISTLLLLLLIPGCVKFDPIDYSEINPSIFPKTEADIQALVLSCYYPLRGSWWDGINSDSERGQMFVNESCTEILMGKFGAQKLCSELSFNETNAEVTYFYYTREEPYGFFSKISRCTLVMDAIENSSLSQDIKNKYLAEVRCARGYLSYILFDMYGPLVIAPLEVLKNPLLEKPLPRLSNEEMVQFIEDDLLFAAEYLPLPIDAEYGKFSRGLAKTLLIRLYLHETVNDKAYYDQVELLARELMGSEYGYALVEDYPSLFEIGTMDKNNPEYIFVIPSSQAGPNTSQWLMMAMPPDSDSPVKGWGTVQSSWWFYDSFEPADTRKTYLITEYVSSDDNQVVNRANPRATMDLGPIPQKYKMDPTVPGNSGFSKQDIVEYRYPEVLLSLAEAIVMKPTGGTVTAEALELMNKVRRRAKLENKLLSDFPTTESFIDQLLTERSHEFWCENGQYRADLIRFDKLYDRVMLLNNGVAPYASKDKYLYPLPLSVIVDGKGEVKQNPGYAQ
jgi:starch-binding outer membrane protein, SusD/RagB family